MKELVIVALYIYASISDIQNRTIPNRIPALLLLLWPIWLVINKDYSEMLVSGLWSELFVIGILAKRMTKCYNLVKVEFCYNKEVRD